MGSLLNKRAKTGILVLGIGNVLLSDEGIGVQAIMELKRRYDFPPEVEFMDGGTSGMELLPAVCDCESLIVIDAVKAGLPAGTMITIKGPDVPKVFMTKISPHQLGISDILATASLTNDLPDNMVLFGVEPENLDVGLTLSDSVRDGFDKLLDAVLEELRRMGFSPLPSTCPTAARATRHLDSLFSAGGGDR